MALRTVVNTPLARWYTKRTTFHMNVFACSMPRASTEVRLATFPATSTSRRPSHRAPRDSPSQMKKIGSRGMERSQMSRISSGLSLTKRATSSGFTSDCRCSSASAATNSASIRPSRASRASASSGVLRSRQRVRSAAFSVRRASSVSVGWLMSPTE
jgi:hypothetical protein